MKIICIGRNYADHAKELGNEVPEEPVIFMKPESALMRKGDAFYIPDWSQDIHYELELVVKIKRMGKNIEARFAHKYYAELSLGIDFTARDVQSRLKTLGLPWEKAKAFDQSAAVGEWLPVKDYSLSGLGFSLLKNGVRVQEGNTSQMIYSVDEIIAHSSAWFTLKTGDIIFTGTPKGVGKIEAGDLLEAYLEDRCVLKLNIR